jgi:hypothetical protein
MRKNKNHRASFMDVDDHLKKNKLNFAATYLANVLMERNEKESLERVL